MQTSQEQLRMGLLIDSECQQILMASAKLRDTLVSWLGILWHDELERGWVQAVDADTFMRKICDLRSILATLADMPDMQMPGTETNWEFLKTRSPILGS